MIKLPILTFFSLVIIGTSSCNKSSIEYDFNGKVIESVDVLPLEGVEVVLTQKKFSSSVTNQNWQPAGDDITDANGDFFINFPRERVTDFRFEFTKAGYFEESFEFTSQEAQVGVPNFNDVVMDAESWLKIDIENISPSPGDAMTLELSDFREGCAGCATNGNIYFGEVVDTVLKFKSTAGRYVHMLFKDETSSLLVIDSVYMTPFDTVTYIHDY